MMRPDLRLCPSSTIGLRQGPRTRVSAALTQTMRLLALPQAALQAEIEAALAENPVLALRPLHHCPGCGRPTPQKGLCPACRGSCDGEPIVFLVPAEDFRPPAPPPETFEAHQDPLTPPQNVTLAEYVLRQIAPDLADEERPIAAAILVNLDDDGLLSVPLVEIAFQLQVPLRRVRAVLERIQQADPLGVGSPSPQEAMLVQLRALAERGPVPPHVEAALRLGLEWLQPHRLPALARRLGISRRAAREVLEFIQANLTPYPGRMAWGDLHQGRPAPMALPTTPDIVFSLPEGQPEGPLVVEVLTPGLRLYIPPEVRQALRTSDSANGEARSALEGAALLLKSLRQRAHTLAQLARLLAREQRAFILQGPRYLHPMTQAEAAQRLGVHESTISRAVADKFAQLPDGRLIPLSQFFDRSLPARALLREIIAAETHPLSDAELARRLSAALGYRVARRTVTKYRALEGIPPAHLRRERVGRTP